MSNEQILKKAFTRAVENGWLKDSPIQIVGMNEKLIREKEYVKYIFSHSFAKAFATYIYSTEHRKRFLAPNYDYDSKEEAITHIQFDFLMEMVVEEDRLKYIAKFL